MIWVAVAALFISALGAIAITTELIPLLRAAKLFLAERTLELQAKREHRELREATRDDIAV